MGRIVLLCVRDEDLDGGYFDRELTERGKERSNSVYKELIKEFGNLGEIKVLVGPSDKGYPMAEHLSKRLGTNLYGQPITDIWSGIDNFLEAINKLKPWDTLVFIENVFVEDSYCGPKELISTWNKYSALFGRQEINIEWPPSPHHLALVIDFAELLPLILVERANSAAA